MKITSFVLQKSPEDTRSIAERIRAHRDSVFKIGLSNTVAKAVQDGSLREYKVETLEESTTTA